MYRASELAPDRDSEATNPPELSGSSMTDDIAQVSSTTADHMPERAFKSSKSEDTRYPTSGSYAKRQKSCYNTELWRLMGDAVTVSFIGSTTDSNTFQVMFMDTILRTANPQVKI